MSDYWSAPQRALDAAGITGSGAALLDAWDSLVAECETGTSGTSRSSTTSFVRDQLETIIRAAELAAFAEHRELMSNVSPIDNRFQQLLVPDAMRNGTGGWWRLGILSRAGRDYADYVRAVYGVAVDIVD